ncbi:MAG: hypothetical protein KAH77_02900 [Thiomargarita sp.]|nr:hypothetical protein [Thiomargarita sp.]
MHILNRMFLILLFTLLPSSFVLAGDMGFVGTTLPIVLNDTKKAITFDRISRKLSIIIAHIGLTTAIEFKIAGICFKDVKIPCPSQKEFERYLSKRDKRSCQKIGSPIALTSPRSRSGIVRFFHEKRDQEGSVYMRKLARQQDLGGVIRSFWVHYGNESEEISHLIEKEREIEISVAGYMPDSNAEQISSVIITLDENMRFSGKQLRKDLTPQVSEIFTNLLNSQNGYGFAEVEVEHVVTETDVNEDF